MGSFFFITMQGQNIIFQFICSRVLFFCYFPPVNESSHGIWIQGTRTSVSSPWLTDDGDDLPYIGPNYRDFASDPSRPPLELNFNKDNTFLGGPGDSYYHVICEM